MLKNVTTIIRSAGERTIEFCRYLISQQIIENNIFIINETPFSSAIIKSFKIGYENQLPWTLCIDADVLLAEESILKLVNLAESIDKNVFVVQGLVRDKMFTVKRSAGNHLYRTSYLEKALSNIPYEGTTLRPESHMIQEMAKVGYPWFQSDIMIGVHDYKQYYKDIFRKVFIQCKKFEKFKIYLERIWKKNRYFDKDYEIALQTIKISNDYVGNTFIDINRIPDEAQKILKILNLKEKHDLSPTDFRLTYPDRTIRQTKTDEDFYEFERMITPPTGIIPGPSINEKIVKRKFVFF